MVLVVEGETRRDATSNIEGTLEWLYSVPSLKASAEAFHGTKNVVTSDVDLLYVHQGEVATLRLDHERDSLPSCVASDDATSCLIIVLHSNKACIIAHLDTPMRVMSFFDECRTFLNQIEDQTNIDVFLLGGVYDENSIDYRTLRTIIDQFSRDPERDFVIKLFCVEKLNTVIIPCPRGPRRGVLINFPIATGMVYNWRSRKVLAATVGWSARGPVPVLRLARLHSMVQSVTPVFNPVNCSIFVKPIKFYIPHTCFPEALTEEVMRSHSTTPDQEPPSYFEGCRAVAVLIAHQPQASFWFREGRQLSFFPQNCKEINSTSAYWVPGDAVSVFADSHPLTKITTQSTS